MLVNHLRYALKNRSFMAKDNVTDMFMSQLSWPTNIRYLPPRFKASGKIRFLLGFHRQPTDNRPESSGA
jgi:hypothetical protein